MPFVHKYVFKFGNDRLKLCDKGWNLFVRSQFFFRASSFSIHVQLLRGYYLPFGRLAPKDKACFQIS